MLDKQEAGHVADEHLKDQMAAVHSQVWLNKLGFFLSKTSPLFLTYLFYKVQRS